MRDWLYRMLTLAAIVGLWAYLAEVSSLVRLVVSDPEQVVGFLRTWFASGNAVSDVGATLVAALCGYVLGMVIGGLVAALLAFQPTLAEVFEPFLSLFNGIPRIIVAPLFVLMFGTGIIPRIIDAALMVFFVAFFGVYSGLRSIDRVLIDNARCLGGQGLQLARLLYLPAVLSWVMTSMRIGIGFAFLGTIVGEFVGSTNGVGFLINRGQQTNSPEVIVGGILVLAAIAILLDLLVAKTETRYSAWRVF